MIGRWRQVGLFQSLLGRWKVRLTAVAALALVESVLLPLVEPDLKDLAELLALGAMGLAGGPIVAGAIQGLAARRTNVDELVSLALIGCVALGEYSSGAVVAVLMQMGTLAEEFTAARARAGIEQLIRMKPPRARLWREDGEVEVDAAALRPGDTIVVRPGEAVGADGEVIWGQSWVDESAITGESLGQAKGVGSAVYAGTWNRGGALRVRVTRAGEDTVLARIVALVVDAESQQSPVIRLADAFAGFFTPVILTVAAGVLWLTADWNRALAVLIVGCPCALILATPTAVVAALACAARQGVLIKSGAILEEAARLDTFFFDKTGTLTTGRLHVVELTVQEPFVREEVLALAAGAERLSRHPLATVLVEYAQAQGVVVPHPEEFLEVAGQGVRARIGSREVAVGSRDFVGRQLARGEELAGAGPAGDRAALYVACDGRLAGQVQFRDEVREAAVGGLQRLRRLGVRELAILTGDRPEAAEAVRRITGVDRVQAGLLPEQKLAVVREAIQAGRRVAVVGDGVNDAPALAAAHVGIAMGASAVPAALETADVALVDDRIERVGLLVSVARQMRRVIGQNLGFAAVFNLGALVASGIGLLGPAWAAVFHNLSSLAVVLNSARLVRAR